jgi:hypothetical protein
VVCCTLPELIVGTASNWYLPGPRNGHGALGDHEVDGSTRSIGQGPHVIYSALPSEGEDLEAMHRFGRSSAARRPSSQVLDRVDLSDNRVVADGHGVVFAYEASYSRLSTRHALGRLSNLVRLA